MWPWATETTTTSNGGTQEDKFEENVKQQGQLLLIGIPVMATGCGWIYFWHANPIHIGIGLLIMGVGLALTGLGFKKISERLTLVLFIAGVIFGLLGAYILSRIRFHMPIG